MLWCNFYVGTGLFGYSQTGYLLAVAAHFLACRVAITQPEGIHPGSVLHDRPSVRCRGCLCLLEASLKINTQTPPWVICLGIGQRPPPRAAPESWAVAAPGDYAGQKVEGQEGCVRTGERAQGTFPAHGARTCCVPNCLFKLTKK